VLFPQSEHPYNQGNSLEPSQGAANICRVVRIAIHILYQGAINRPSRLIGRKPGRWDEDQWEFKDEGETKCEGDVAARLEAGFAR
jgi:hypothetical protein